MTRSPLGTQTDAVELDPTRANRLFVVAVLAAGVAAMLMVVRPELSLTALPEDVVATVNGAPITRATYLRARQALREDRRRGEQPGDAQHVLDRLIDEELLVQHALSEGLQRSDLRSRANLTSAALAVLSTTAEADEPGEAELRAFHEEHSARFVTPPGVVLERRFHASGAHEDVNDAAALAAFEDAIDAPVPLPAGALGRRRLTRAFGATAAERLLAPDAPVGEWLGPFPHDGGRSVVRITQRSEGEPQAFKVVREQVAALYRRTAGERAVRAFLDAQRSASEVAVTDTLEAPTQ